MLRFDPYSSVFVLTTTPKMGQRICMKSNRMTWQWCALLASGVLLITGCSNKDAELAAQRQKELEAVRAELEQAKASAATQETELARLRKDNLELLRLRNEIHQLRDENKQLSQQAQVAQVQVQQVQEQVRAQAQAVEAKAQKAAEVFATQQQTLACMNNLRHIQAAKRQWAQAYGKDANAVPTMRDIAPYLKIADLKCPAGGTYTLNPVGEAPTCTSPTHVMVR